MWLCSFCISPERSDKYIGNIIGQVNQFRPEFFIGTVLSAQIKGYGFFVVPVYFKEIVTQLIFQTFGLFFMQNRLCEYFKNPVFFAGFTFIAVQPSL